MAKKIKFKVVVEVDGKDVASEYIGYQVIQAIVNCHTNWGEPHNYESVFKYAATYPHSSVRCEVAAAAKDPEVFEILTKHRDMNVQKALIQNEAFLTWVSQDQLIDIIRSDDSLAAELADRFRSLSENLNIDVALIQRELLKLNNYQVDRNLMNNSSDKKLPSKMKSHPDPEIALEALGRLEG